ncbi:MAG: RnfABCDGE type electron transport complex subunit D [Spirochaetales bacterium]|nr:RnfABCDGE type electron transport complex subunit D [Spirochaetales bacterium]MCF7937149.1 RnfABCDGE type electron transport complex subunit D [Spirochaetales bacterium]
MSTTETAEKTAQKPAAQNLIVSSSPQIHDRSKTTRIMIDVIIALIPAAVWGVYIFGIPALLTLVLSIVSAVGVEWLLTLGTKPSTVTDGSAFLTGLLIGFNMPPSVPLYIPIVASAFAIAVVKWSFGGLGSNWMNPALAGRVFVFFSWTGAMTRWKLPMAWSAQGVDSVTGPTVLGAVQSGLFDFSGTVSGPLEFISRDGLMPLDVSYADLFFGRVPGCIGEVSALLLIIGAAYLFLRKVITWEIPLTYFGSFALLVWVFGGTRFGLGLFSGDVLFHLLSGGLMLGVLFMATDMVTSPLTPKGMIIFGLGAGFLTFMIRFFGSFPEGVSLAIIVMNVFVPMINRAVKPVRFGTLEQKGKEAAS